MKVLWVAIMPFCSPNFIAQESVNRSNNRSTKESLQLRQEMAHISEEQAAPEKENSSSYSPVSSAHSDLNPPSPTAYVQESPTYATQNATPWLTPIGEAGYAISCVQLQSSPAQAAIGAAARYSLPGNWKIRIRYEDFDDGSALFSGTNQALKEFTFVTDRQVALCFLVREEYRRDFSNYLFFLTDTPDALSHSQTTATLGLMSSWGSKQVVGKQFAWGQTCSTLQHSSH
ncbi:MAG TPA: hypothetical protein VK638_54860 [Edaphobacter sp.]|nr:hypothetical protein [Edaphobacter sp.]